MKQLIIYDLDGTLVDTAQDITSAVNHMLAQLGRPPLDRAAVERSVGYGMEPLIARCLPDVGEDDRRRAILIYRTHYGEHLVDTSRLYPGALDVLQHFASRIQAVLTNKPDPHSTQLLTALGVADRFADIVAGNSGYPKKPAPASLLALLAKHHAAPGQALFIGDSAVDIETSRCAGVMSAAVAHGLTPRSELEAAAPDHLVADFTEFLDVARHEQW